MKPYVLILVLLTLGVAWAEDTEQKFKDWAMRCPEQGACVLEQRVFVKGNSTLPLVHVAFQIAGEPPQPLVSVRAPLGVLVNPGVQLSIDGRAPKTIAFHHCRPDGCLALFPLAAELREGLERGLEAKIRFHLADGRSLGVPLSLLGISAGLQGLEETAR